jgi:hypothetical protein
VEHDERAAAPPGFVFCAGDERSRQPPIAQRLIDPHRLAARSAHPDAAGDAGEDATVVVAEERSRIPAQPDDGCGDRGSSNVFLEQRQFGPDPGESSTRRRCEALHRLSTSDG